MKLSISLYSFAREYFDRKYTLEQCIAKAAEIGYKGIEIIGPQMIDNYPNPTEQFYEKWHEWMDKYHVEPACLDVFNEYMVLKSRKMTDEEQCGQLRRDMRIANKMGIHVVRVMNLYTPQQLAEIVTRSAQILGIPIEADGALEIASRSRGTPRIANRMLKRVRDFAQIISDGVITYQSAKIGLDRLEVDEIGLDANDRRMLKTLIQFYNGGPVGIETLAAAIGEEAVTLEDVYEPYLMQIGFLSRTPRGRCATHAAYLHLGLKPPAQAEKETMQQKIDGI